MVVDAVVPGEMHLDLIRHGLIGDPSVGLNAWAARWVEEYLWWYRRDFDISADLIGRRAWIVFEQLDLRARVLLNGELGDTQANAFRLFRAEVTDRLREGVNVLVVEIDSGTFAGGSWAPDERGDSNQMKRPWLRKPAYQFGGTDHRHTSRSASAAMRTP